MNYQILINPMPRCCAECPCSWSHYAKRHMECQIYDVNINDINPGVERLPNCPLKPLILCKDCKKWKTDDCSKTTRTEWNHDEHGIPACITTYSPDPDDYCKDGEAK